MRPLASLERFFERLFEGQSARLFHTKLQPIQLQRRVERAMESGRVRDGDRTVVPHRFAVHLAAPDLAALREAHPTLAADLADAALEFARSHHYRLADRPTVALVADVAVEPGDATVAAAVEPEHVDDAALVAPTGTPPADQTAVFVMPTVDAPKARLREVRPDGTSRTFMIDGRPLTIGRAPDNGLVLFDGRVSRHHARLYGRRGALLLADLGSTNGSWVNDRRVEEMALGEGDRIRVGDTILLVESFEDA
ncbi:MAG TPA: FhaA domain-containing protein [Candidatus Limnocylindrales bacterium]|nr:FhaA domain-containing protein [Candidatus Limnocylindrales bacterium]